MPALTASRFTRGTQSPFENCLPPPLLDDCPRGPRLLQPAREHRVARRNAHPAIGRREASPIRGEKDPRVWRGGENERVGHRAESARGPRVCRATRRPQRAQPCHRAHRHLLSLLTPLAVDSCRAEMHAMEGASNPLGERRPLIDRSRTGFGENHAWWTLSSSTHSPTRCCSLTCEVSFGTRTGRLLRCSARPAPARW